MEQRSVIEVYFENGGNHPAIIISNDLVKEIEGYVIVIMMTSTKWDDEFSFPLNSEMFSPKLYIPKNHCEARLHILSVPLIDSKIIIPNSHKCKMKSTYFKEMINKLFETTFTTKEL